MKGAIPNSARMKRRKVAGHFQAGWENEKKETDGSSGSSLIFSSFVYLSTTSDPLPKGKSRFPFSGNRKNLPT